MGKIEIECNYNLRIKMKSKELNTHKRIWIKGELGN
jgi:hypothetical protein